MFCLFQNYGEVFYVPPPDAEPELPPLPSVQRKHWLTATVRTNPFTFSNIRHFGCNASLTPKEDVELPASETSEHEYSIVTSSPPAIFAVARIPLRAAPYAYEFEKERHELQACDVSAPSVVLTPLTYGDVKLIGANVHYPAIWAYSTCINTDETSVDCVHWNQVVQYFLWRTGNRLMLFYDRSELVSQSSRVLKVEDLQRFLEKWECPIESTMACGINLIDQLAQSGYLSSQFATMQVTWFKALNAVDYRFPTLQEITALDGNSAVASEVIFHPVNFTDNLPWLEGRKYPFSPIANRDITSRFYNGLCGSYSNTIPSNIHINFSQSWMQYEDVLLIVVFNSPFYNNIRYIEAMYRTLFPRILYCGPLPLDRVEFPWTRDYSLSFVTFDPSDGNHTAGAFSYDCMKKAITMNYRGIGGYLVVADDMFLLPHSLRHYDKNSIWFMVDGIRIGEITKLRECRLGMCDFHPHWHWWADYQHATINALKGLKKQNSDTFYKCHQQLVRLNGGEMRPNARNADIYFVPVRLEQQVSELFGHFLEHRVFVEIAVPTVLNCLSGKGDAQHIPGVLNWEESRDMSWLFFNNKHLLGKRFLHPTKWSRIETFTEMKELYCAKLIPFLFDPYGRIENKIH
jgi:hypothetical protein